MSDAVLSGPVASVLRDGTLVRLATVSATGQPHAAPFWYAFDGDRIVISTMENWTVRNLRNHPDCAALVDVGIHFPSLRGVLIRGRATIYEQGQSRPPEVDALVELIGAQHAHEREAAEYQQYLAWDRRPPVLLEICAESATWFDLGAAAMGRTGRGSERPVGPGT